MPRVIIKNFISNNDETSHIQIPLLKELEDRFRGRVEFEYLNVNENESQVSKYRIKELPTIIIECDGRERERFVGLTQQLFLKKAIEKALSECR
jgi:thioredoxin-like negative regulator of GroEL